ncbi:MAG: N-acetylmuramoyl-L-alanine amidase [Stackebrandtia sp.]
MRRLPLAAATTVLLLAVAGCAAAAEPHASDPSEAADSDAKPLAGRTITVDPGHNGGNADHPEIVDEPVDAGTHEKSCDTTGTETDDGYAEHEFNFDVATRLADLLRDAGADVVLTRDSDDGVGPCFSERAEIANEAGSDAAVNIHADGGPDDEGGFHIITPREIDGLTDDVAETSHDLAVDVRDAYRDGVEEIPPADYIGDDGINVRDDMGGLNLSEVPKVLAECGNMRNADDAALLSDPDVRQQIAEALADGLTRFLLE